MSELKQPYNYPFYLTNNTQFINGSKILKICPLGVEHIDDIDVSINNSNISLFNKDNDGIRLKLEDGVDDYTDISSTINLKNDTVPFNLNVNINRQLTGTDTSNGYYFSTDSDLIFEGDRSIAIHFTTGKTINDIAQGIVTDISGSGAGIFMAIQTDGTFYAYIGNTLLTLNVRAFENTPYFIVLTKSLTNSTGKVYINGKLIKTITSFSNPLEPSSLLLGAFTIAYPSNFLGKIHSCQLFNYELNQEDVNQLFKGINQIPFNNFVNNAIADFNLNGLTNDNWISNNGNTILTKYGDPKLSYAKISKITV